MEPKNEGLEDDLPFQLGDFQVPAVNFHGCIFVTVKTRSRPSKIPANAIDAILEQVSLFAA